MIIIQQEASRSCPDLEIHTSCLEKLADCNDTEEGELESDTLARESEWERDCTEGFPAGD